MTSQFSSVCVSSAKRVKPQTKSSSIILLCLKILFLLAKDNLGESEMKELPDCLNGMSESVMQGAWYHSECRKSLVNKVNTEKIKSQTASLEYSVRGHGHPSSISPEFTRPK